MAIVFPSQDFLTELARSLNQDRECEQSAKTFEGGLTLILEPKDTAPTAVYLASDDSRFMTGQASVVEGGFSVV